MNPQVNALIGSIRTRIESSLKTLGMFDEEDAAGGDLGAVNPSDVLDAFDAFIGGIADALLAEFDMSDDDAIDFVFEVVDAMVEEDLLSPIPDEADIQALAAWIGKAESAGLGAHVMQAAEELAEE